MYLLNIIYKHLNATLFNVLFTAISLSLHIWRIHSRASSRRTAIISLMEAEEGTTFFASLPSTTLWIIDLMYSLSIILLDKCVRLLLVLLAGRGYVADEYVLLQVRLRDTVNLVYHSL